DGEDISKVPAHRRVELGISQAPEGRGIFPGMTVLENLDMGAYSRRDRSDLASDIDRVFGLFPRLAERRSQSGGTLSGGEQQMLAIGRALMARPRVLLLDDPRVGRAPRLVAQIVEIIAEINEQGVTILLVEQNAAQALKRADRAYLLETGRIVRGAAASELLADDAVRAAYLGGDIEGCPGPHRGATNPSLLGRNHAMRRQHYIKLLAFLTAGALVLGACGGGENKDETNGPGSGPAPAKTDR